MSAKCALTFPPLGDPEEVRLQHGRMTTGTLAFVALALDVLVWIAMGSIAEEGLAAVVDNRDIVNVVAHATKMRATPIIDDEWGCPLLFSCCSCFKF
jgi:hypothetical protein